MKPECSILTYHSPKKNSTKVVEEVSERKYTDQEMKEMRAIYSD